MSYDHINPRRRRRAAAAEPYSGAESDETSGQADETPGAEKKVGYRNPPKEHQWKKGTSGNPKGKAPGTKSLHTLIDQELDVEVEVTERGKKRKYTKRRVAAMRVVNKAVEGDDKALTVLLRREGNMTTVVADTAADPDEPISPHEQSILDYFLEAGRAAAESQLRRPEP